MRRQHVEQAAQDRLCRADQRDRGFGEPRRLLRIGIDADDREIAVDAPMQEWHVQMRAHGQHHVRLGPQVAADRQVDRERIAIVEHAAAAAVGEDRRLQEMRQARHLGGRVLRAATGDDQRPFCRAEALRRRLDGILVDRRIGDRQRRLRRDGA